MNYDELNRVIQESGMKRGSIAQALGLTDWQFSRRVNGKVAWKTNEILAFAKVLRLTKSQRDHIFLP